jgi:ribosomal protein S18 acetylase RimI-like enzyme
MFEGYGVPPAQGTVRFGTSSDAPQVAALHTTAIKEGFLSSLGEPFLRRLYARIASSRRAFLLVARGERTGASSPQADIAGFVAGSAGVGRLYREFAWRDGPAVALSSGARLVRSMPRVIETLRYGASDGDPGDVRDAETELLAIAVAYNARRSGIGAALVRSFMATAAASGSSSARVVVGATNRAGRSLYGSAGFTEVGRFELHAGSESILMRARLLDTEA